MQSQYWFSRITSPCQISLTCLIDWLAKWILQGFRAHQQKALQLYQALWAHRKSHLKVFVQKFRRVWSWILNPFYSDTELLYCYKDGWVTVMLMTALWLMWHCHSGRTRKLFHLHWPSIKLHRESIQLPTKSAVTDAVIWWYKKLLYTLSFYHFFLSLSHSICRCVGNYWW